MFFKRNLNNYFKTLHLMLFVLDISTNTTVVRSTIFINITKIKTREYQWSEIASNPFILLNMSITSSLVLLFLLCVSFHACNAQRLGEVDKEHEKKFIHPSKNDEKVSLVKISVTPKLKPALLNQHGAVNIGDTMVKPSRVNKDDHKPRSTSKAKKVKGQEVKISGATQTDQEALVSVSWHVPHKKRGEQQPGFNLDYSPPKTHPPVHN